MHVVFLESSEHFFAASGLNPLLPILCIGHTLCSVLCFGVLAGGLLELVELSLGDVHIQGDRNNRPSLSEVERR